MFKDIIVNLGLSKGSETVGDYAISIASIARSTHYRHRNVVCLKHSRGKHGLSSDRKN